MASVGGVLRKTFWQFAVISFSAPVVTAVEASSFADFSPHSSDFSALAAAVQPFPLAMALSCRCGSEWQHGYGPDEDKDEGYGGGQHRIHTVAIP